MAVRKRNWIFVFDYEADPELNGETVEASVYQFISQRARGRTMKFGNCVMACDPADALDIKMRFHEHIVEIDHLS